jgi:RNA-directed DNA polymerase
VPPPLRSWSLGRRSGRVTTAPYPPPRPSLIVAPPNGSGKGWETVDFLGYTIGRCYSPRTGQAYIGTHPSAKVIQRLCHEISELTGRRWAWLDEREQVARLNRKLEGWANYFHLGQVTKAYQAVDRHACHRLRQWLRSKYQSRTMGYSRCPNESLHERLGLVRLKGRTRDFPWAKV